MFDGIHLTVFMGPLPAPTPIPLPLAEALQSLQVSVQRERTGFQLKFSTNKLSLIQTALLPAGMLDPMVTRVVAVVTHRGMPHVILDGVITRHDISPGHEPGQSVLTLTGDDLSVLMNIVELKLPYTAMTDAAKVATILTKYAAFGVKPMVIPPPADSPKNVQEGFDFQTGTDLSYIQGLAHNCGYTFYIEPGPLPLTSTAYFGPNVRIPVPQVPALNVNMDWATNVDSLNFSLNGLSSQTTVVTIFDPVTQKIPLPIPMPRVDVGQPPLGARPLAPAKVRFADRVANLSPAEAAKRVFGLLREGADAAGGSGSLSVARYGAILQARMLVGVRGAGLACDGLYFVESVTHDLKRGEYKQSFTLTRNGPVSLTPIVPNLP